MSMRPMPDARRTLLATLLVAPALACTVEPTADVGGVTTPVAESGDPSNETSTATPDTGDDGATSSSSTSATADESSSDVTGSGPLLDVGAVDDTGVIPDGCDGAPDLVHVLVPGGPLADIWSLDPEDVSFAPVTFLACPE